MLTCKVWWDSPLGYDGKESLAWAAGWNAAVAEEAAAPKPRAAVFGDLGFTGCIVISRWWNNSPFSPGCQRRVVAMHPALGAGFAPLSVTERITQYLGNGGLFNPELMDHQAVRDLLMAARTAIWRQENALGSQWKPPVISF